MSLRKKTLLVISATLIGLVGGLYATSSTILLGSLQRAEQQDTRELVRGVLNVFAQTEDEFSSRFVDWSAWDDTYTFIEDGNNNYIESNLVPELLANLKINLVLYVHASGRVVFSTGFDWKNQKRTPLPPGIQEHLFPEGSLLQHSYTNSPRTGLLLLPEGPMVITSQPIITSRKTGPSRGSLIFGRYLDAEEIRKLSKITRTRLTLYGLNDPQMPADFQIVRAALVGQIQPPSRRASLPGTQDALRETVIASTKLNTSNPQYPVVVRPLNDNAIAGYTVLKDLYGQPTLLLRVDVRREIYKQGQKSQRYLIASVLVMGLMFGGVTLLLVEKLVLRRIAHLSTGVNHIGTNSDLSARLFVDGKDELSRLASTINRMLEALEHSQHQLQESEERHRAVVEQASEGIFLCDVQTRRILEVNTAFEQLLGYTSKENQQLTVYDFIASDRESIDRDLQQILLEKRLSLGERRYCRRDGSLVDVEVSASLIAYGGREVMCAVMRNITDRKRVEEALRQAEEKYRQIFENATEGIFQITPDGRLISANPMLVRIYGYDSVEELMANVTNIGEQLHVNPQRYARFLAKLQKQKGVFNFVSQVYRKDGSIVWIAENVHAVHDEKGTLLYCEGTVEDITKRKIVEEALRYQQEQAERLLINILPEPIAARLRLEENTIADSFPAVTVLFADLVGFTQLSAEVPPTELVSLLNDIFSAFDQLAEQYGLEKIKTIGDAYMVAGGLPMPRPDHAEAIAEMALDMQQVITEFQTTNSRTFSIRIGINTGPVVAGVIGIKRLIYDLWGDTVNTASRMESHGIPGCIQVTDTTYELLKDKYVFEDRGVIPVKGKGEMRTYLLVGKKLPVIVPASSQSASIG